MRREKMFIGEGWVDSVSGETFPDINPASGEIFAKVPKADAADADRAIAAAHAAQKKWAHTLPGERAQLLHGASETLKANLQEFTHVLVAETGAVSAKASFETDCVVDLLHAAREDCRRILSKSIPSDHEGLSMTVYQPVGTVVAISSWIFPLFLSMKKVAYALAAGNTVVLNPSRETPVIGLKLA